jgi:hypothetical protein
MNPYLITALVILALAATAQYFMGMKKNRWIASQISKGTEEALRPSSTNYVNIGSTIGYNFAYVLVGEWASAKGTFTLSPRHSLLYLPFSRILGISDRFFINVFTKKKLKGEGHIVEASYLRRAKIQGVDSMERREKAVGGKRFILLWKGPDVIASELESLLDGMPDPSRLRHFCSYADNKTFFLHILPRAGEVKGYLDEMMNRLPRFLETAKE